MKLKIIIFCLSIALLGLRTALGFEYWQALPATPIIPSDNPLTVERVLLGKQLYFDPILSQDGSLTCNSCHNIFADGADSRSKSIGYNNTKSGRNSPTVWNVAYQSVLSWDGKHKSLEDHLQSHLLTKNISGFQNRSSLEMRIDSVPDYHNSFLQEYKSTKGVTLTDVTKALACFIRTLTTPNSPYDRYLKGDLTALTQKALRGKELFHEIGCLACHFGPNMSGPAPGPGLKMGDGFYELFPNYKTSAYIKKYNLNHDLGIFELDGFERHKSLWRVPTLRNIGVTAPYFHNGSVSTLNEAVKVMAETQLNMTLNQNQVEEIVAFLHTLTGLFPLQIMPAIPMNSGRSKYTLE